jgi:hypothetical protein
MSSKRDESLKDLSRKVTYEVDEDILVEDVLNEGEMEVKIDLTDENKQNDETNQNRIEDDEETNVGWCEWCCGGWFSRKTTNVRNATRRATKRYRDLRASTMATLMAR